MGGVLNQADVLGLAETLLPGQENVRVFPVAAAQASRSESAATLCTRARVRPATAEKLMAFGIMESPVYCRIFTFWVPKDGAWTAADFPQVNWRVYVDYASGATEVYEIKATKTVALDVMWSAVGVKQT